MDTNTGITSTPRQSALGGTSADVPLRSPSFPTRLNQVAFVGRVIDNAGGSSQRKSESRWFDGAGGCSQGDLAPTIVCNAQDVQPMGVGKAVCKSGELKDFPILHSTATMAVTTHGTAPLPVPVPSEGASVSEINYRRRNSVAAGNIHGRVCHVIRCEQAAFGNMDGYPTVPLCEAHLKENIRRLRSNVGQIDGKGKSAKRNVCEYPGCANKPRYGSIKGGPVRVCKHHKKAGMFSTRKGQILYVIHNGDAWRSVLPSLTSSAGEGAEEAPRPSSAKRQESRPSSPADAVWLKPKSSTSQPSRPAKSLGKKSRTLKRKATTATQKAIDTDSSASGSDQTASTPRSYKPSNMTGMAPSVEIKVLQKEREKAVAEASATGRRPRVPSRKALEASGKLKNEGVQWMTKEMYKAEVQLRKELKERQKEAAAAEMEMGHMLDTIEVRIKVDNSVDVGRAGRRVGGFTGGEDARIRGWESQGSTPVTFKRKTQAAVEPSLPGERRQASNTAQSKRKAKSGASAEGSSGKRSRTETGEDSEKMKERSSSPRLGKTGGKLPK